MLKDSLKRGKDVLLHDAKDFFIFVVFTIIGTLIFYKQTQDEFTATIIISLLWIFFWSESDKKGKVFLTFAAVVGYVHELIGVDVGYFTYLGGIFGGVPLWILPGYGAIFWASYNFGKVFEEAYEKKSWFPKLTYVFLILTPFIMAADWIYLDFSSHPISILLWFAISLALFKSWDEIRLAYFVALFTVFDEVMGEIIGVWNHASFSLFSLMSGYVFLLWMCLTITEVLEGKKKWRLIEVAGALILLIMFGWDVIARFLHI